MMRSIETLETLRRRPESAETVLPRLAPRPGPSGTCRSSPILEAIFRDTAIPQLAARHFAAAPTAGAAPLTARAADLAAIVLRGDMEAALALIGQQMGRATVLVSLRTALIEPAARHLGDMWMHDDCSELEVTFGLCLLQTAVRRLESERPVGLWNDGAAGAVLVVPQPGEMHGLSAALAAHAFRGAGWAVQCDFPVDDDALQDLVASKWFDVVDMSLSAAFRREDRLPAMAHSIDLVHAVSANRGLKIIVGGRIFMEQQIALAQVGADARSDAMVSLHVPGRRARAA